MSYARFGYDKSDVYVYLDVGGYFACCACGLNVGDGAAWPATERFTTTDALLAHLGRHREAGDTVPEDTYEELRAERDENDEWIRAQAAPPSTRGEDE